MNSLNRLKAASGCPMDWKAMTGDDQSRHCSQCQKQVHNLSAMTRKEANALVASSHGNLCIGFTLGADGKLVSKSEPSLLSEGKNWLLRGLAFGTGLVLAGCATAAPPPKEQPVASCTEPTTSTDQPKNDTKAMTPMFIGDMGSFFVENHQVPPERQGTKEKSFYPKP